MARLKEFVKGKIMFGAYLPDQAGQHLHENALSFKSKGSMGNYIPIWNEISFNKESFTLTEGKSITNDITGLDKFQRRSTLSDEVVREKMLDITTNDLTVGPTRLIFNFSAIPLTVNNRDQVRKTYHGLENNKMKQYAGKVIIFEITAINTPDYITSITGIDNYLEALMSEYMTSNDNTIKETYKMLNFANDLYREHMMNNVKLKSNTIKVVSVLELGADVVNEIIKGEDYFVKAFGLVITAKNILDVPVNPYSELATLSLEEMQAVNKDGTTQIYIHDKEGVIGDKYYVTAGEARRVAVIKNSEQVEGLHINPSNSQTYQYFSLSEIDGLPFLYDSKSEAMEGADVRSKFLTETEEMKREQERWLVESSARERKLVEASRVREIADKKELAEKTKEIELLKMEATALQHGTKTEREVLSTSHTRELNESDSLKVMIKSLMDTQKQNSEFVSMRRKDYYDERKYERDSTVETLKTVAAVAGVVATGVLIYSKVSK